MKSIYIEIFEKKKSCFVGVKLRYGRWVAELSHKGKKYSAGSYDSELDAGRAINARCDSLGIPHKNAQIGAGKLYIPQPKSKTSVYQCVRRTKNGTWKAEFKHEGKRIYVGTYESEHHAARAVNMKCLLLEISEKNPDAGIAQSLEEGRVSGSSGEKFRKRIPRPARRTTPSKERRPLVGKKRATVVSSPLCPTRPVIANRFVPKPPRAVKLTPQTTEYSSDIPEHIRRMTSEEVKTWVRSGKGLNRAPIVNIFDELEITGAELRDVTIDMLEMMGLPRFFAKRLIAKIEALINSPEPMKSAAIVKVESTQDVDKQTPEEAKECSEETHQSDQASEEEKMFETLSRRRFWIEGKTGGSGR